MTRSSLTTVPPVRSPVRPDRRFALYVCLAAGAWACMVRQVWPFDRRPCVALRRGALLAKSSGAWLQTAVSEVLAAVPMTRGYLVELGYDA